MKKILFKKYAKGFTLIELLVVIAIIGILTAIITANFTTAKSRARDAKRISDLAQIQLTLEQVFEKCNIYPDKIEPESNGVYNNIGGSYCFDKKLSDFTSKIPTDSGISYVYVPISQNLGPVTDYVLQATLENDNAVFIDSIDPSAPGVPGGYCVKSNKQYCVVPK